MFGKLLLSTVIIAFAVEAVHPLLPFTDPSMLDDCNKYFSEQAQFNKAYDCYNSIYPIPKPEMPSCKVITYRSPDLNHNDGQNFNFITEDILIMTQILGFYEDSNTTMYLTQNDDHPGRMQGIFRHELGHHFEYLRTGDGNPDHSSKFYQKCEPPQFDPDKS